MRDSPHTLTTDPSPTTHPASAGPLAIDVVGTGSVGTNLAVRFAELGHHVRFGVRDASSPKTAAARSQVPAATTIPLGEVGTRSDGSRVDVVVLAVPAGAVVDVLDATGGLDGVTMVDATNDVGAALPEGCRSVVDLIRRHRPDLQVVKAFNTIGAELFLDPVIDGRPAFLPIAGPDGGAATIAGLATAMGFDVQVLRGDRAVELVESFARLWIHLAFAEGEGRSFGFARVRRPATP